MDRLEGLSDMVRRASLSGNLVKLYDMWQGTAEELCALLAMPEALIFKDIVLIKENDQAFLYSEQYMSRQYAASAARAASADTIELIAQAVRYDSSTYPRPTPADTFGSKPYFLSAEAISAALGKMSADSKYADIRLTRSSNGTVYLFSSDGLSPSHAESLAEWLSVGQFENP